MNATFEGRASATGTGRFGTDGAHHHNNAGPGRGVPARNARKLPRRSRRGISIFGVILGVAVAALVTLGLISAYQGVVTNTRTQATLNTVLIMDTSIRRSYANQPQFEANLTPGLWAAVPTTSIQGSGTTRRIVTPWGGQMYAGGGANPDRDGTGVASPNRFFITITELPEDACEKIAASFLNRADVVSVNPEGTASSAPNAARTSVSAINTECDGGDNDAVAIVFRG